MKNQIKNKKKKSSDEELIEIINLKKDEDTTDWYDKNKFKKILTAIDSNSFNHKNKNWSSDLTTLITWSMILKIIQLVKHLLKKTKCTKRNKKSRNKK